MARSSWYASSGGGARKTDIIAVCLPSTALICRCIEEKVLAPFLEARQKEVAEIMVTLFDQEKIMEIHDYHIAEAARREGIQKGRTEGRAEGLVDALKSLIQNSGMAAENAMELLGIPETARSQYAEMLKQ